MGLYGSPDLTKKQDQEVGENETRKPIKRNIGFIIAVLIAFFVGYFVGDNAAISRVNRQIGGSSQNKTVAADQKQGGNKQETEDKSDAGKKQLNEPPIYPDELDLNITILEPNSIGTVYMEATFTNNTEYPITSYSATVLLKDKNEKTYLSTHDTVLPGETSPIFKTFGPDTGKEEDYEILTLDVRARLDNGKTLSIEFNYKLDEARWWEYEN